MVNSGCNKKHDMMVAMVIECSANSHNAVNFINEKFHFMSFFSITSIRIRVPKPIEKDCVPIAIKTQPTIMAMASIFSLPFP